MGNTVTEQPQPQQEAEQKYPSIPISNDPPPDWHEFKLYVGIDFGTDGSGLAYALKDGTVYIHNLWKECGPKEKPKTSVLFDAASNATHYGAEARRAYTTAEHNIGWKLFERFKMHLYDDPQWKSKIQNVEEKIDKVDLKPEIHPTNDEKASVPSANVFVAELKYLKKHKDKFIKKNFNKLSIKPHEIQYFLTVPAIWSDVAKQKMKDWAGKAGLITFKNQLQIVYEPDCAALSIQHAILRNMKNNAQKNKSHRPQIDINVTFEKGDRYLLVDIGGGTCDIASHEVIEEFAIAEVMHPSGGPWGGTEIDNKFETILQDVIGTEWINEFKQDPECKQMYLQLMDNFISYSKATFFDVKRDNKYHSITMPQQFSDFLLEKFENQNNNVNDNINDINNTGNYKYSNPTDDISDSLISEENENNKSTPHKPYTRYINETNETNETNDTNELLNRHLQQRCDQIYQDKDLVKINAKHNGYYSLDLHNDLWIELFHVIMNPIIEHCTKILQKNEMRHCKYIFLVGGFANSTYFQQTMKSKFNSKHVSVIIPELPQLCIVDGAARYGLDPSFVKIRRLAKTYGIEVSTRIDCIDEKKKELFPPNYIENNQYLNKEKKAMYVTGCFSIFAARNEAIHRDGKPIIHEFSKQSKNKKPLRVTIYETDKKEPLIVSQAQELGEIIIDVCEIDQMKVVVEFCYLDSLLTVYAYEKGRRDLKKEKNVNYKIHQ